MAKLWAWMKKIANKLGEIAQEMLRDDFSDMDDLNAKIAEKKKRKGRYPWAVSGDTHDD